MSSVVLVRSGRFGKPDAESVQTLGAVVVRKLYGAGRARIAALPAREFAPLLVIAAALGLPLAAWLAHAWLANFVERSLAACLALPLTLVALVAMTALAATRHALIAMNMRPTQALWE